MKTPLSVLEADIFLHSDPSGEMKKPDFLISTHVKLGSLVFCYSPNLLCEDFASLDSELSREAVEPQSVRRERGAGPSLARPLGLAQGLSCCSKAPVHASETPSFTARLAGPHPHTQLCQMLHNLSSSNKWRTSIAPSC